MTASKKRLIYTIITIVLLSVEVCIALFVNDSFVRPYMGDVLVVMVIYTFIRIIIPDKVRLLPLYIFLFAAGVEALQLIGIVELLGLSSNRFLSVLIGSVFDVKDIICYGIGCIILCVFEWRKYILSCKNNE